MLSNLIYRFVFGAILTFHCYGIGMAQQVHPLDSGQALRIPIVFNNVYNTQQQKITYAQLHIQLNQLNRDFNVENDTTPIPYPFNHRVGNPNIRFYLSKSHSSINEVPTQTQVFGNSAIYSTADGGMDPIANDLNLNVWITNLPPTTSGWAKTVNENATEEGVVIDYEYVGIGPIAHRAEGRTLVHEIGHWMGLGHIWTNSCSTDDGIWDTPNQDFPNTGCDTFTASCGLLNMTKNFMDYGDDPCRLYFSKGQVDSMRYFLLEYKSDLLLNGIDLGQEELLDATNVHFYPNPAKDMLYVESDLGIASLIISDQVGREVSSISMSDSGPITEIDLTKLRDYRGLLFLVGRTVDNKIFRSKIEKVD